MPTLITSDGVSLHYRDEGSGKAVVFSAGWAMDGSWWRHQLELSSTYRVVVLDPRSQGRSEKVTRGIRMGRQAQDLRELLDTLDVDDVTYVGWSRSTSIGLAYWEMFGAHRIARLALIGVTPCMSRRSDWEWGYSMDPIEFQDQILADHEGVVRGVVEAIFHRLPAQQQLEEMVASTMLTPALAGARMLDDHGAIDWRDMLHTISIPTLVCVGRYDRNAPPPAAEHVSRAIPDAQLVVFEESAHAPFIEEPEKFNRLLRQFIEEGLPVDPEAASGAEGTQ